MYKQYIQSNQELAENIKFIRECFGFTQQQIAVKLNVERSTYSYYESGKTEPNLQIIIKLCTIYNIEITDLVTKEGFKKTRININNKNFFKNKCK